MQCVGEPSVDMPAEPGQDVRSETLRRVAGQAEPLRALPIRSVPAADSQSSACHAS
jgi:hypothetical protein